MSTPVRIRRRLSSSHLDLPEIEELIGKEVEIVVTEVSTSQDIADRFPLRGSILWFDDPDGPAVPPEEWEALQ